MRKFFLALIVCLVISALGWTAHATVTQTFETIPGTTTAVWTLTWTAGADGTVTATPIDSAILAKVKGSWIAMVITDPGTTAPTNLYDITFIDSHGIDIMGGTLLDRSATVSEQAIPMIRSGIYGGRLVTESITVTWANNLVNGGQGVIRVLFVR